MSLITTALGLVLIFLVLSLLASSVQEVIASWFSLRGRTFGEALERLLTNVEVKEGQEPVFDDSLLKAFRKHNIFRQFLPQKGWYHYSQIGDDKNPSYLSASTFSQILFHVMKVKDFDSLEKYVNDMNEGELKTYLLDLIDDSDRDVTVFRKKMEKWYGDMMDRASGWYKRHVHNILLVIGLFLACLLNADTFSIYSKVSSIQAGSAQEEAIWALAQSYVDEKEANFNNQLTSFRSTVDSLKNVPDSLRTFSTLEEQNRLLRVQQDTLIADITGTNSPLGLGWTPEEWEAFKKESWYSWLAKLIGMIITSLAIALGAPFWFDLLNKIVNVRKAGNYEVVEEEKKPNTA